VRVIAATNKELQYEVQQKRFRPDLYFRLRSVNIVIPPLRNRREDIPLLVEHFVKEFANRNNIHFEGFTDDATELIMEYRWPGNVRELKNVIESMLVLNNGRRLTGDDVRQNLKEYQSPIADRNLPVIANKSVEQAERELIYRALIELKGSILDLREMMIHGLPSQTPAENPESGRSNGNGVATLDEMERRMIISALERHKGNRRLAAKELDISERTLYRKIKEFGLQE
jgi:DNA-binding NtrC family response regulator